MRLTTKTIYSKVLFRPAVILLLFVGLLFSGAEGISLLPFSDDSTRLMRSDEAAVETETDVYNPAVPRFGSQKKSESQIKSRSETVAGTFPIGPEPTFRSGSNVKKLEFAVGVFSPPDLLSDSLGRAPPAI